LRKLANAARLLREHEGLAQLKTLELAQRAAEGANTTLVLGLDPTTVAAQDLNVEVGAPACRGHGRGRRRSARGRRNATGIATRRTVMQNYEDIESPGVPIKAWTRGVELDPNALEQLRNTARIPVVHGHVAVMPDVHWGMGATVGSVIPTLGAVIPAAVGVDIGCGMCAVETTLSASDLPDDLKPLRNTIERAVRTAGARPQGRRQARQGRVVGAAEARHQPVEGAPRGRLRAPVRALPVAREVEQRHHLGTLGTATTSSRSVSTRRTGLDSCCTPARAASATPSHRTSSSARRRTWRTRSGACPTRTSPTSREGHAPLRRLRRGRAAGRRSSRA
jgi:hypothetical protein